MSLTLEDLEDTYMAAQSTWSSAEYLRLGYERIMTRSMRIGKQLKALTFVVAAITALSGSLSAYVDLTLLTILAGMLTAIASAVAATYSPDETLKRFSAYNAQLLTIKSDLEFTCMELNTQAKREVKSEVISSMRELAKKVIDINGTEPPEPNEDNKKKAREESLRSPCGLKLIDVQKDIQRHKGLSPAQLLASYAEEEHPEEEADDIIASETFD